MVESGGVAIRALEDEKGVRVTDQIERRGVDFRTDGLVNPEQADSQAFPYPVDAAVAISGATFSVRGTPAVYLYDSDLNPLEDLTAVGSRELEAGTYFIQFETTLKLYIKLQGPLSVERDSDSSKVLLDESQRVLLGARRHHDLPAGTISTTAEPRDIMRALSLLGSCLKTSTPRRSYPSLRGHPPAIQLDDEFSVPETIDSPETGIKVELPPDIGGAFVAAPLAHYLPAELVVGPEPRIVTDQGFSHELSGESGFEAEVEKVLKQTFFLDCVARKEITTLPIVERERAADEMSLDFVEIRNMAPAKRLEYYLEPSYEALKQVIPSWKLVSRVQPNPANIEVLPYLVKDLAVIRTPSNEPKPDPAVSSAVSGFLRGHPSNTDRDGGKTWDNTHSTKYVNVSAADSVEQAWVGDGIPIGATKVVTGAFQNPNGHEEQDNDLRIAVVCNDEEMLTEGSAVAEVYGTREEVPFTVEIHRNLSTEELRKVLTGANDFLHYVGHIEEAGFECEDGYLDAANIEETCVDSFVLNACRSYWQGLALIQAGAVGGVVTLDDIINSGAVRVGKTIARLLNQGFPLRPALDIAGQRSVYGNQYLVVGDGNFDIATNRGLGPTLTQVHPQEDEYELEVTCYPTRIVGMGSVFRPFLQRDPNTWFLTGSRLAEFSVDREELRNYLNRDVHPVIFDGGLTWSDRIDLDE